jgi:hypothetical protein
MKNLDLTGNLTGNLNETPDNALEMADSGYQTPELHEIGRSRDLVQGASCCGPYDGRGYYPQ